MDWTGPPFLVHEQSVKITGLVLTDGYCSKETTAPGQCCYGPYGFGVLPVNTRPNNELIENPFGR